MIDRVSLDMLYLQVIEELDLGWVTADSQTRDILSAYEGKKQKREVRLYNVFKKKSSLLLQDKKFSIKYYKTRKVFYWECIELCVVNHI